MYSLPRSLSNTPSATIWPICIPFGPNSLARDWDKARRPNFAEANEAKLAEALSAAVAPVKSNVGGYLGCPSAAESSSGGRACEKIKAPLLLIREWDGRLLHLTFPVALEGGERNVEEWAPEVFAVAAAQVEHCGGYRDSKFLDFFRGLGVNHIR